jgi:hypothetical protein
VVTPLVGLTPRLTDVPEQTHGTLMCGSSVPGRVLRPQDGVMRVPRGRCVCFTSMAWPGP